MLVDVHCHLTHPRFAEDVQAVLQRSKQALKAVITTASTVTDLETALTLARAHPKFLYVAAAVDPYHAGLSDLSAQLDQLRAKGASLVAIGETGLDTTYPVHLHKQEQLFQQQLELARELKLPVVVHARGAEEQVLHQMAHAEVPWVWHHFHKLKFLARALDAGAVLSLPTLKSKDLDSISSQAPLERVMCETDAPYAWKEGRNEPANVLFAYQRLAKQNEMELEKITPVVFKTIQHLFRIR